MGDDVSKKDFLTVGDLAAFLSVSKTKVYRLSESRTIQTIRVGGQLRFRKTAILEWLQKNQVEPIQ